ncbi:MAG: hypothetical protein IJT91_04675, partial [Clostridia bacterium]|nr:hypothetical protein [Clostridia bacterium]
MKKYLTRVLFILVVFSLTVPFLLSFPTLAAEDMTLEEIEKLWEKLQKGYMSAGFQSVEERMAGNDIISPMALMYEKDGYALYVDERSGEVICLKLKPDGNGGYVTKEYTVTRNSTKTKEKFYDYQVYWTTNPVSIGGSKTLSGGVTSESEKMKLYSQVNINYTVISTNNAAIFYSFSDAALNNQISIKEIKKGVRAEYIIGKQAVKTVVPHLLTKDRYDNIIARLKAT